MNFIASSLLCIEGATLFVDFQAFQISGDNLQPNHLLQISENILCSLARNSGFKTNAKCKIEREEAKYSTLAKNQKIYWDVNLTNIH